MSASVSQPTAGVSVCVVRDGQVLLVKRGRAHYRGLWSLPGGRVELGEPLREAALRELKEETAIEAELVRLLDCIDIIHRNAKGKVDAHYVLTVFGARWCAGDARAGGDAAQVRWCEPGALDAIKLTPGTASLIRRVVPLLTEN